jgi:hypothetical protein
MVPEVLDLGRDHNEYNHRAQGQGTRSWADHHCQGLGINFDNNVEIYLTYENSKSVPKFSKVLQDNLFIVYYI